MVKLPALVRKCIEKSDEFVFATSSENANPNVVYIGYLKILDDEKILIADNKMVKTKENILKNPHGAIVVRDNEVGSYQIKGPVEYHENDEYHDMVKSWCAEKYARKGGVILHVNEVFNGSKKLA